MDISEQKKKKNKKSRVTLMNKHDTIRKKKGGKRGQRQRDGLRVKETEHDHFAADSNTLCNQTREFMNRAGSLSIPDACQRRTFSITTVLMNDSLQNLSTSCC